MATVALLGTVTWTTTAGDKTVTAAPTLGDLIVVICGVSGLVGGTTNVSDNQAGANAGTYSQIGSVFTGFSTQGALSAWVRNKLITSNASTVFTAAQAGSSGGGLAVMRISGMSIVGEGAVRGFGGQSAGGAGATPAPVLLARIGDVFTGTQAALTSNAIITAVCNGATATGVVVQRTGYTEDFDNGYSTPGTGLEVSHRSSGETGSTLTFGGTSATAFASIGIELDASVPQYDWVSPGKADKDANRFLQGAVGRSSLF